MIKTIGNNISYKDTTCSTEAELAKIVNPAHGDIAYVIATQKNYMFDGDSAQWVEQKKKESDVTRDEFEDLVDKVDELQLYKFPNATIVGEPTINNGQISGFSQTNYLRFPFLVDFKNKPFVIDVEFMTGANVTSQENIFDSDFGLAFAIRNARFVFAVSSNGTSWNIGEGVGTYTVLANTTYRVRLAWDGSNYTLAYSLDGGKTYTVDITKASTEQPFPKQIFIGVGQSDVTVLNAFSGVINLNQAYLHIEDKLIWQGMDDVGLATRLSVDLDNIDPDGEARIKEIAGKPDTSNIEKTIADNWNGTGYNLIPFPYYDGASKTNNGITYTVNSDGSVTANGTATAESKFQLFLRSIGNVKLKLGKYRASGCPQNGSTSTYYIECGFSKDDDSFGRWGYDVGNSLEFEVTTDRGENRNAQIIIYIKSGQTVDNLTFYPMLVEVAEDGTYPTKYQRYASGNVELTDEISQKEFELTELKMLGWNVPKECPIKNEVNGNQFIQKVGRLSLKDRYWNADGIGVGSINVFKIPILLNTKTYGNNVKWNIYVEGYTTRPLVTDHVHDVASNDLSVGGRSAGGNYFEFSTTIYTTRADFESYMNNAELYLYYELVTPIVTKIDGNEVVERKVEITHVTYFAGDGETITTQALFDAGIRGGTYIVNAHRSESSSSTLFYVFFSTYQDEITDFDCYKIAGQGDTIERTDEYTLKYIGADEQPSDTVTFDFIKITDFDNF